MDNRTLRYRNTRLLVDQAGGISKFASMIGKGQSQASHFAGTNPIKGIGNKVAREIEVAFNKNYGWLDVLHPEECQINVLSYVSDLLNDDLNFINKQIATNTYFYIKGIIYTLEVTGNIDTSTMLDFCQRLDDLINKFD